MTYGRCFPHLQRDVTQFTKSFPAGVSAAFFRMGGCALNVTQFLYYFYDWRSLLQKVGQVFAQFGWSSKFKERSQIGLKWSMLLINSLLFYYFPCEASKNHELPCNAGTGKCWKEAGSHISVYTLCVCLRTELSEVSQVQKNCGSSFGRDWEKVPETLTKNR